ncbi:lysozyme-like domain-containing protein [Obelidium mucronatum]|nr:lysozyme-like domain-containing protein [Obelidium mucronatum]
MQASDTCEGVTTAFGISATNYKILNPTLNCFDTVMMAGNHYCLSGRYPNSTAVFGGAPSNTTSAEVKLSDKCASTLTIQQANQTCIDVVREHANVSVSLLSRWNTGINCWNLPVGSKICIQGDFPDLPVKPTRLPSPSAVPSNTESIGTAVIPVATTTPAESPSPSPPPPPKPAPGSIPSLINQYEFDRAMQNCGIWHDSLYTSMIKGFQAPLASRQELAILLGNIAHESGHFTATREIACRNCNCRYGCWYGRGYIQLTGEGNYQQASWALGIPEIYSNPEVVADSEEVNWAVVQWFWTTAVQWRLYQNGMSLASSVQAVNGYIECGSMGGWAGINSDRARMTQCFSDQFGAGLGWEDYC